MGRPAAAASWAHGTRLAGTDAIFPTHWAAYHAGVTAPSRAVDLILRLEALALFVGGVLVFIQLNGQPLWLLPLLLAPDLSMIGYLGGPRLGALTYNLLHNLAVAIAAVGIGWFAAVAPLALAGAILVAHVGMDRALGFGLKLPTDFRDTHLGRIGR